MLKNVFKNDKFPKKKYVCYVDAWSDIRQYYVHESVDGNEGQRLQMTKTQFENFELVLKTNGWIEANHI